MAMSDLLSAICLIFIIEGSLYALFPDGMKRMVAMVLEQPSSQLRSVGLTAAILGFAVLWLVRG